MSLAMFAAPINDNYNITSPNNSDNSDTIINQKRHKRTQRKYPKIESFNNSKMNSILDKIHTNTYEDDDDDDTIQPTESTTKQKPKVETFNVLGKSPIPNYDSNENLELNNYGNYGDNKTNDEYYKKILPGYKQPVFKERDEYPSQDVLMKKLNYLISLMEEQQDEKTNNVTEEVVLYSFLGIFIIFIADTFFKAGKYTR